MSGDRTTPRHFEIVASTRRRWSAEQKRAIVDEIAAAGGSVSEVARRHSVHTSQLFRWRRVQRTERGAQVPPAETPKFVPVMLPPPRAETSSLARSGSIEIAIVGGRTLRVGSDVDTAALVRIIAALEGCR
jgi:transposase